MTKLRPPVSIENTLHRVLGELGAERAAEVTGRARSYLNDACDPDKPQLLTVRDAIALDLACVEAGDPTFPLYETYGLLLRAATAERHADALAIGRHAAAVAKESGEATAALVSAALAPGDVPAMEHALRQTEESLEASTDAIATIGAQLARARATGPP